MPESHRTVELNITPASYLATISLNALLDNLGIQIGETLVVKQRTQNGFILETQYYRISKTMIESHLLPLRRVA